MHKLLQWHGQPSLSWERSETSVSYLQTNLSCLTEKFELLITAITDTNLKKYANSHQCTKRKFHVNDTLFPNSSIFLGKELATALCLVKDILGLGYVQNISGNLQNVLRSLQTWLGFLQKSWHTQGKHFTPVTWKKLAGTCLCGTSYLVTLAFNIDNNDKYEVNSLYLTTTSFYLWKWGGKPSSGD